MAVVKGTNGSETLGWTEGATNDADTIFGFGGHDFLYGEGGNDRLKGGGGADELHGGAGKDWADYSDSAEGIHVSLMDNFAYFGTAEGDTFDSIENVTGSAHDDLITGDKNANRLHGEGGNDHLTGGLGADRLDGGDGLDFAEYWTSKEGVTINLTSGYTSGGDAYGDTFVSIEGLAGTGFNDQLTGNGANNTLLGYGGHDTLKGGGGSDKLDGGAGPDLMFGGMGDDQYWIDESGDLVYEAGDSGWDVVYSDINYTLPDNFESLYLTDEAGAIEATGNALSNVIQGNELGNAIYGLGGSDVLYGNGGGDWFVWLSMDDMGKEGSADTLYDFDFAEGDLLHLSFIEANIYQPGQAFTFIGMQDFTLNLATPENSDVVPGEIRYYHANGSTYIQMNTGSSPDVEGVIHIYGIVTPEASWFAL